MREIVHTSKANWSLCLPGWLGQGHLICLSGNGRLLHEVESLFEFLCLLRGWVGWLRIHENKSIIPDVYPNSPWPVLLLCHCLRLFLWSEHSDTVLVTCLESSPFRFTYHRQEWSPQNLARLEMELQDLKLHCGVARDHRYLLTVYCVQAQLCGLCSYNFIWALQQPEEVPVFYSHARNEVIQVSKV